MGCLCAKMLTRILLFYMLLFGGIAYAASPVILDYRATFVPGFDAQGHLAVAIRRYYIDSTPYFLIVNPTTLQTKVLPVTDFKSRSTNPQAAPGYYTMASLEKMPYLIALSNYSSPPYQLQNYGLTHANNAVQGMFLTIDMCPSSKPFEEAFFKSLVELSNNTHQPIPIALSMSGLWMINHDKEFDWLIEQQKNNKLTITWVNHSFTHIYYRDLPIDKNFMLIRPNDFVDEVLETEKILLQKGQLPSVFFRYPGLVADKDLILKLHELSLIPLGSNAWLAKGETARQGSIILVHGNSNEHQGIVDMMLLLQQNDLVLLPISHAVLPPKK